MHQKSGSTSVLGKTVKALVTLLQWLLIIAMTLLVLDVVWGVFTRYVMGEQANWTEELARFLLIWVSLLGGALAFETKGHLGVDYFVNKFDPNVHKGVTLLSHVIVMFFALSIFLIGGCRVVYDTLMHEQLTPALGWKMGHVYLAIPVSGFFMSMFTIDNFIETIKTSAAHPGATEASQEES